MEILDALEQGKITANKAAVLLKNQAAAGKPAKVPPRNKKGRWLKIRVKDKEHNLRFYIPLFLLRFGLFIGNKALSCKYHADNNAGMQIAQNIISGFHMQDIKDLVNVLKDCGPIDLVNVTDDDSQVYISIV